MNDFSNVPMTVDTFANMNSEEREAWHRWGAREENEERYQQFSFDAEAECLELVDDILGSESFGDEDEETKPERVIRFIIEGLGQDETVSTILQLRDYSSYFPDDEDEEGDDEENDRRREDENEQ